MLDSIFFFVHNKDDNDNNHDGQILFSTYNSLYNFQGVNGKYHHHHYYYHFRLLFGEKEKKCLSYTLLLYVHSIQVKGFIIM